MKHFLRTEILQRIGSAVVLAPLALALVWVGGSWLATGFAVCAGIMSFEWFRMLGRTGFSCHVPATAGLAAGIVALVLGTPLHASIAALVAAAFAGMVTFVPRSRIAVWGAAGPLAFGIPLAFAWHLREEISEGRGLILWCVAVVWATDITAYAAGRIFGGPQLAPRMSPAKTWSGAVTGLALGALAGTVAGAIIGWSAWAGLLGGAAIGIVAQVGDLAESAAKRTHGIKDMGSLIPGHGGFLDRLDSFLAAMAVLGVWVFLKEQFA